MERPSAAIPEVDQLGNVRMVDEFAAFRMIVQSRLTFRLDLMGTRSMPQGRADLPRAKSLSLSPNLTSDPRKW
jgi:hypothetical protein